MKSLRITVISPAFHRYYVNLIKTVLKSSVCLGHQTLAVVCLSVKLRGPEFIPETLQLLCLTHPICGGQALVKP